MRDNGVIVTGSLAYDRIFDFPGRFADVILPGRIHVLNASFTVDDVRESFGGTAGNIAYTLRLLRCPVAIVGTVGQDFQPYARWLRRRKIDTRGIVTVPQKPTAAAYIVTDRDDNQLSAFQPGAMAGEARSNAAFLGRLIGRARYAIVAPGNVSAMVRYVRQYQKAGLPYLFDPGQVIPVFSRSELKFCLRRAAGVVSNDYELSLLMKRSGIGESALLRTVEYLITTFGPRGATVRSPTRRWRIVAAHPRSELDPTGAGDAFRAGFVAGVLRGLPLLVAARMGAVASAYTVEQYGTQTHFFSLPSFARRYKENYHEVLSFEKD